MKSEDEDATSEVVARDAEGDELPCSALAWRSQRGRRDGKAKVGGLTKVECHGVQHSNQVLVGHRAQGTSLEN